MNCVYCIDTAGAGPSLTILLIPTRMRIARIANIMIAKQPFRLFFCRDAG